MMITCARWIATCTADAALLWHPSVIARICMSAWFYGRVVQWALH